MPGMEYIKAFVNLFSSLIVVFITAIFGLVGFVFIHLATLSGTDLLIIFGSFCALCVGLFIFINLFIEYAAKLKRI